MTDSAGSRHTFGKSEKICSEIAVNRLIKEGSSLFSYPIRMLYLWHPLNENEPKRSLVISVPKRRFKHAVDRNRAKRLIRESYRLNKTRFPLADNYRLELFFIYVGEEILSYDRISSAIIKLSEKLSHHTPKGSDLDPVPSH